MNMFVLFVSNRIRPTIFNLPSLGYRLMESLGELKIENRSMYIYLSPLLVKVQKNSRILLNFQNYPHKSQSRTKLSKQCLGIQGGLVANTSNAILKSKNIYAIL